MRVTGGILRSRRLAVPSGTVVRPTQDRVREALFSSLALRIPGCRFLDLFAGSGAVGLDAWSRGAALVCWVERDNRVLRVLRQNVEQLCGSPGTDEPLGAWHVIQADVLRWLQLGGEGGPYDIIFADPPYDQDGRQDWAGRMRMSLAAGSLLAPDGLLVIEQAADETTGAHEGWTQTAEKRYGQSRLSIWMRRK
jgi:16S rRNA (guanine966-N2)-methyltransferase